MRRALTRPARVCGVAAALACGAVFASAGCGGDDDGTVTTPRAPGPAAIEGREASRGKQIFTGEGGCASCHTLADAGASGTVGPNLDQVLEGETAAEIRRSIVEPNADIASGFRPGIMPGDYEERLGAEKIDDLVAYLTSTASR